MMRIPCVATETWMYVIMASVVVGFKYSRGEIRCYCNDASCIGKGYMCKSSIGHCFSILTPDGATGFRSVHGCAELLPSSTDCRQPDMDYLEYDVTGSGGIHQLRSRVVCCADDMCNYSTDNAPPNHALVDPSDSPPHDVKGNHWMGAMQGHKSTDQNLADDFTEKKASRFGQQYSVHEEVTLQHSVWFRAAVIAVPIAGLVILALLVLLAVHMLRGDYVIKTPSIDRSSSSCGCGEPHVSVVVADECGVVRTVLAPSGECSQDDRWVERQTKRPKYEQFRTSSDFSESNLCDFCQSHVKCITMTANTGKPPV